MATTPHPLFLFGEQSDERFGDLASNGSTRPGGRGSGIGDDRRSAEPGTRPFAREGRGPLASVVPFESDPHGRWLKVGSGWRRLTGHPPDSAEGRGWLEAIHPEDREWVGQAWSRWGDSETPFALEFRLQGPDGRHGQVRVEAKVSHDLAGTFVGHSGQLRKVCDHREERDSLRSLAKELLLPQGAGFFSHASRTFLERAEGDLVFIGLRDPSNPGRLQIPAWNEGGRIREWIELPIPGTPLQDALQRDVVVPGGVASRYPECHWVRELGLESLAAIPILCPDGGAGGLVGMGGRTALPDLDRVVRFLDVLGMATSSHLALRRAEERFFNLTDAVPDAVILTDAEGRIVRANRRADDVFGWTPEELTGQPVEVLIPHEFRQEHTSHRANWMASGRPTANGEHRGTLRGVRKDGRHFSAEVGLAGLDTMDGIVSMAVVRDLTVSKEVEKALKETQALLDDALESIEEGVILWDAGDRIAITNRRAREVHPALGDLLRPGVELSRVLEALGRLGLVSLPESLTMDEFVHEELRRFRRADGSERRVHLSDGRIWALATLPSQQGGRVTVLTEETDKVKTEEQFRRAQKMEALGKLTGGMAHDFNNYLGVIFGYLELLRDEVELTPDAREFLDQALQGAAKGAELTRSLLSFARRQPLQPRISRIEGCLSDTLELIRRTLGGDVEIRLEVDPHLWPVRIDEEQFSSALVNLANNARDAMPHGGHLCVSARNVELDQDYLSTHPYAAIGPHVLLQVTDGGVGMSEDTRTRAFEPFFSTKGPGHGTGLGLSMVYGFVKQSGGHLDIYSEPGRGTSVKIFFPRAPVDAGPDAPGDSRPPDPPGGTETVLVVEDNAELRGSVMHQLRSMGYRVLEADTGEAALPMLEADPGIQLLFTDVVMPGTLDGKALSRHAERINPRIAVLFTSGFSGDVLRPELDLGPGRSLLSKPYRKADLARAIRKVLEAPRDRESAG
ncbi:MAG: PAS domain S-box protein [Gemmatimonadales bacterium]|nr:MAG: PAS domain S-box protein [Gemmatimonadales bacterium]